MMENTMRVTTEAEKTSAKNISTLIRNVVGHYTKATTSVQDAAIAILEHTKEYNDCSAAPRLCRAVPARERNSLVGWFAVFSPIGVSMGKTAADDRVKLTKPENRLNVKRRTEGKPEFDIEGAKATMWNTDPLGLNPEPKPLNTILDFYQAVDKMFTRFIKEVDDGEKYDPLDAHNIKVAAEEMRLLMNKFRSDNLGKVLVEKAKADPVPETQQAASPSLATVNG